jgi:LSD1 subclass zinc finger protein
MAVLRLHDFECPACGHSQEELLDVLPNATHVHCSKCRTIMNHVVIGGRGFTFNSFWHPHLDHKPVHITSWKQYRKELRSRGLENELGS